MKIIIFCLIAIALVSSTYFASSEGTSNEKQNVSSQYKCQGTELCITGKVTKIVDGDTIYLKDYKIRLSLTNTPEKGETGFKEATSFTKKLCPLGSTITVDQDDKQKKDAYGRVLGKVFCSGKVLNSELLYKGLANILKQYCSKSEFSGEVWAQKYGCKMTTHEIKQQIPKESQTPTPKDSDFDGIQDSSDICPTQAETKNGYQDTDGCPDKTPPSDSDSDGIQDDNDQCIYKKETVNGYQDSDGCPDEVPKESQTPTTAENQCDPSYPDFCIPSPPPDLDCKDIPQKRFTVLQPDPHRFDGDKDGIGCES